MSYFTPASRRESTSTADGPMTHAIPVLSRRLGSWHFSLHRQCLNVPDLARSYDVAAAGWQRTIGRLDYPRAYEALLTRALNETPSLRSANDLRALDCGTGTGALSSALAAVAGVPTRIDALDLSPRMLDVARERFRASSLDVTLQHGDVRHLPYNDNAFDVAMAGHLLEHLPDPVTALREMVRVVRPGGLVLTCLTRRTLAGLWIHFKWRTHMVRPAEAEHWLVAAGLCNVRCVSSDGCGPFGCLSLACLGTKAEPKAD